MIMLSVRGALDAFERRMRFHLQAFHKHGEIWNKNSQETDEENLANNFTFMPFHTC